MAYRNAFVVVEAVHRDYPGLIGDGARYGQFVDQVAHRLNRLDGEVRWGRKARNADGTDANGDALAYLITPGDRTRKILVDIIISGPDPGMVDPTSSPAWQELLGDNPGNGYWTEPMTPDRDLLDPPWLLARVTDLEARVAALMASAVHAHALPDYTGTLRIFGWSFTVVSRPKEPQ
jgi:hypothetical protein